MGKLLPRTVAVRSLRGVTALAIVLAGVGIAAQQQGAFDRRFEGQLFGVRHEMSTPRFPAGVAFANGVLYVADTGINELGEIDRNGTVIAYGSNGIEIPMPAADWRADRPDDPSSPLHNLLPNQLAGVTVSIDGAANTTAILVSDSNTDRVLAFDLQGMHLFTMQLPWPERTLERGVTVYAEYVIPVINGMSMAPGSRFVYNSDASTLELEGSFAAAWAPNYGLSAGAVLGYTDQEFAFDGDGVFEAVPDAALSDGAAPDGSMREPMGVTFDSDGNLFVLDTVTERIHAYGPDLAPLFTFGTPVLGGTTAEFHEPYAMAYWPDTDPDGPGPMVAGPGRLFVADQINNRILAYRPNLPGDTLDYLFTIEGFAIDGLNDAQPYSLTVDPATGRLGTSDGSGMTTHVWILQTRRLAGFNLEVLDANQNPVASVCSGQPYHVRFGLTVPAGLPLVTGVAPSLTIDSELQVLASAPVNLSANQAATYTYALTAPGTASNPFVGDLELLAGGTTVSTTDVLYRRGVVPVANCFDRNPPPVVTVTPSAAPQVSGWIAVTEPFTVTIDAADDSAVREISYAFEGANDSGHAFRPVVNADSGSNRQSVQMTLSDIGLTIMRVSAVDDDGARSAEQTFEYFLVEVLDRQSAENQWVSFAPWWSGPPVPNFRYSAVGLPANTSMNPVSGLITGKPGHNCAGDYTVVVTETNPVNGQSSTFSFAWTVTNTYHAPAPVADSFSTDEDAALTVAVPGVLGNDAGISLTAALVTPPIHGTLALNADGSFVYTPSANFHGADTFTYKTNDGLTDSGVALVSIMVSGRNDAPSFAAGADRTVAEDAGLQGVLAWATAMSPGPLNESLQTMTFLVSNSNPALFSVQPAISPVGTLSYQSAPNASGSATVTVRLKDNGGTAHGGVDTSDPKTFEITVTPVNDPPVAANDSYSTRAGTALTVAAPGVLGNDTDVDSTSRTATVLSGPSTGTLLMNTDGSFTYTPLAGFTGNVTFTYLAGDGVSTSTGTVTINVSSVNVRPVCTAATVTPSIIWLPLQQKVYLSVGGIADPDGDTVAVKFTSILQDEPTDGNGDGSTTQDGGIEQNGAKAWVRAERSGSGDGRVYLVGYTATDPAGLSCSGEVQVTVPNDWRTVAVLSRGRWNSVTGQQVAGFLPPDARDDAVTVSPGQQKTIAVLANDLANGQTLTVTLVNQPSKGQAILGANGTITYKAPSNTTGTTSFTYKVTSTGGTDTAVVTITLKKSDDDDNCGDSSHDHQRDSDYRDRDHHRGDHDRCRHRR